MANEKNLIPLNQRTQRERKEIAKKGAIASNKKQAEKKALKDIFETFLELDAPIKMKEKVLEVIPELQNERLSIKASLVAVMIEKILAGDTKAFELMRDTIGEKPVDKHEVETKGFNVVAADKRTKDAIEDL